jgi:hypothetical protein
MLANGILMWTGSKDAVSECPKADGRIVVCVSPIVEVNVQQRNVVPYRRSKRIEAVKRRKTPILRAGSVRKESGRVCVFAHQCVLLARGMAAWIKEQL